MSQTHWRHLTDEKLLGAWDLEDDGKFHDKIVTIESLRTGDFVSSGGKQKKSFIRFKEFEKEMICNKKNMKRLQNLFGTFDYTKFKGNKVTLTVEREKDPQNRGGFCDALRFRTKAPEVAAKETLTADHKKFAAVKTALDSGAYKMDQVKSKYIVSDEIEKLLTNE